MPAPPLKKKSKTKPKKKGDADPFRTPTPSPLRAARKSQKEKSPGKKPKVVSKPRQPQPIQRHPAFRRTPTPPPLEIPQDREDFEEVFGKDRLDAWIFMNPDELHPRAKLWGELSGVPKGHVLVSFRRIFASVSDYSNASTFYITHNFFQPTAADQEGVASPFRRALACKLYMAVHLPDTCNMKPLQNRCPGPLLIGRAETRDGGRFHPTFSPRWTTEDWGIRDMFTSTFPRAEIYDVLQQAVNFEGNDEFIEDMQAWLKRLAEVSTYS